MPLTGFDLVTSADVGAPTVSGTNGEGNALMNYILVTRGGWTRPYHDATTNQSVFRMPGGSQRYLYVAHSSTITGSATIMTARAAEDATGFGIGDLIDPFPTVAQVSAANQSVLISNTASSTTRAWRAIVWESGVELWIEAAGSPNGWNPFFYCDGIPRYSADTYATAISSRNSSSTAINVWTFAATASDINMNNSLNCFFCRSIDGLVKSTRARYYAQSGVNLGALSNAPTLTGAYNSTIHHAPLFMNCSGSASTTVDTTKGVIQRVAIPQFRVLMHNGLGSASIFDTFQDSAYSPGSIIRILGFTAPGLVGWQEDNGWING